MFLDDFIPVQCISSAYTQRRYFYLFLPTLAVLTHINKETSACFKPLVSRLYGFYSLFIPFIPFGVYWQQNNSSLYHALLPLEQHIEVVMSGRRTRIV